MIEESGLVRRAVALQERLLEEIRNEIGETPALTALSPVLGFVTFDPVVLFLEPLGDVPDLPTLVERAMNLHSGSDPRWVGSQVTRRLYRRW